MTGQEIAQRQPQELSHRELSTEQLRYISGTEFVPKSYRGNLPAILACVVTGRELGLGDMESLRSINVIEGKPSLSAELMLRLVRRAGHSVSGESTAEAATAHGRRADNGDEMTVTWTLEMAKRAGVAGKENWKRYPEAMLWARAVSQLCRMLFGDVLSGATYTPDELGDTRPGLLSGTPPAEAPPEDTVTEAPAEDDPVDAEWEPHDDGIVAVAATVEAAPPAEDEEEGRPLFEPPPSVRKRGAAS